MKLKNYSYILLCLIINMNQILSFTKDQMTMKKNGNNKFISHNFNFNLFNNEHNSRYGIASQYSKFGTFSNNERFNKLSYTSNSNFNLGFDMKKYNKFYSRLETENTKINNENNEIIENHENNNNIHPHQKNDFKSEDLDKSEYRISSEQADSNKNPNKNDIKANPNKNQTKKILDSTLKSLYRAINTTFINKDEFSFRRDNRNYDYKILDRQLEEIFHILLYKREKQISLNGVRDFIGIFMNTYNSCDEDQDNVLNFEEFKNCVSKDKYMSMIIPTPPEYSINRNLTDTSENFYSAIFHILDDRNLNYINFVSWMRIKLFAFSWRFCSVNGPYVEEIDFECAIDVISNHRTASRTLLRQVFFVSLYLANNYYLRNIDFLTFTSIASSIRLFGFINIKEDEDITRSEFNLALDGNMLPIRYNQVIIDEFFELVQEYQKTNQGIDLQTFIFYDFTLQLFSVKKPTRPYSINKKEFIQILDSPLFPNRTLAEISMIPQFNMTSESYQMYQYYNISQFSDESNFLYKFLETEIKTSFQTESKVNNKANNKERYHSEEKIRAFKTDSTMEKKSNFQLGLRFRNNLRASKSRYENKNQKYTDEIELFNNKFTNNLYSNALEKGKNDLNLTFNKNETAGRIFDALDSNINGFLSFKDFAIFFQIAYTFTKEDKYSRGKIPAGELYDLYSTYSDFPAVSFILRERSVRFNEFDVNSYIDLLNAVIILKVDDLIKTFLRKTNMQTVNEIDIKFFMTRINMRYIPDSYLNKCVRGMDYNNIPKYDWECCFVQGMNINLNYLESMNNYLRAKNQNLTLVNTVFYNVDRNYQ